MNRFVVVAFKAVAYSIIFVIVWSLCFYLFRAYSLNQKMESIMTSMEQEVTKHNYLTEDAYNMYRGMLLNVANDMNGGDTFVRGFRINYNHDCDTNVPTGNGLTYRKRMDTPGDYGDVMLIEMSVSINALTMFYDPAANNTVDSVQIYDSDEAHSKGLTFTYVSQVPCLRYISVNS